MAIWRIVLNWKNTTLNTLAQNVIYMKDPDGLKTAEQIGAIIDVEFWGATTLGGEGTLRNFTSTNVRLDSLSLQRVSPSPPQGTIPYSTALQTGTDGSAVRHPVLGQLFTLKDGLAGRKHRGRFYHYGVTTAKSNTGGMKSGDITNEVTDWCIEMKTKFMNPATTGLFWMLHHRNAVDGDDFTEIVSIQPRPIFGIQRRRNFGVGI